MKAFYIAGLGLFLVLMRLDPLLAVQDTASEATAAHLEQALVYEEKAIDQDVLIADQKQKMEDYRATHRVNEKVHPTGRVEAMEKHCKAVIQSAQKLKTEFLSFASWHRNQAKDLQQKLEG